MCSRFKVKMDVFGKLSGIWEEYGVWLGEEVTEKLGLMDVWKFWTVEGRWVYRCP
jgi:hypothetical protein